MISSEDCSGERKSANDKVYKLTHEQQIGYSAKGRWQQSVFTHMRTATHCFYHAHA